MKMQYPCHRLVCASLASVFTFRAVAEAPQTSPVHSFPTVARVEYVNECIGRNGGKLAALYQCACTIDRIADALSYDDFVEASTYAKYATLPGEGGAIFRDSNEARKLAKSFRQLEGDAQTKCGIAH